MKALSILLIALMMFTAVPAFAGGTSCGGDKDNEDQAFTNDTHYLCGGGEDKNADNLSYCSRGKKDKDCDKPKPDAEATELCASPCGGDKDKDKDA